MSKFSSFCQGKLTWFVLNEVRASFVAKAITAYSLGIMLLANSNFLISPLMSEGLLKTSVVGAIIFLAGYLAPFILATPEFRTPRKRSEIVIGWSMITDSVFYTSRRGMLEKLIARFQDKDQTPFDLDKHILSWAQIRFNQSPAQGTPLRLKLVSLELYDAELELRSYDQFGTRVFVALALAVGTACMLATLLANTWDVLFG